jgi:hypothetical protein
MFYLAGAYIKGEMFATITVSSDAGRAAVHVVAGAASGAVNAAITGGDIEQSTLIGALSAGMPGNSVLGRIAKGALIGGVVTEMNGGDFAEGAIQGAMTSAIVEVARIVYIAAVKYDVTWESGRDAVAKDPDSYPNEGLNNIGCATDEIDPSSLWDEGGIVSRAANRIPGINAIAGLHDVFQVELDNHFGVAARNILNVPGMAVAAAITIPALMTDRMASHIYYITQLKSDKDD